MFKSVHMDSSAFDKKATKLSFSWSLWYTFETIVRKKPKERKLHGGWKRWEGASMIYFINSISVCNIVLISFGFSNCYRTLFSLT